MMVPNLGLCLIHMNQNQIFKILITRSLDVDHLSLLGPNVLTTDKESPTFRAMVLFLIQGQAITTKILFYSTSLDCFILCPSWIPLL
jgi:hypothetical protein